jgi:hypothetical protein
VWLALQKVLRVASPGKHRRLFIDPMGAGSSSLKDVEKLIEQTGQSHLTAGWNADTSEEDKARFLKQVTQVGDFC